MESSRVHLIPEQKINFHNSINELDRSEENRRIAEELVERYFSERGDGADIDIPILVMNQNNKEPEIVPISPKLDRDSRIIGHSSKSKFERTPDNIGKFRVYIHEDFLPDNPKYFLELLHFCFSQLLVVSFQKSCQVFIKTFSGEFIQEFDSLDSTTGKTGLLKPKVSSKMVPYISAILHPRSFEGDDESNIKNENQSSVIRLDYFPEEIFSKQISMDSALQIIFQHIDPDNESNADVLGNFLNIICKLIHSIFLPNLTQENRYDFFLFLVSKMLKNLNLDDSSNHPISVEKIPRNFLFCSLSNEKLRSPIQRQDMISFLDDYSPISSNALENMSMILEDSPQRNRFETWRNAFTSIFNKTFEALYLFLIFDDESNTRERETNREIINEIKKAYNPETGVWDELVWTVTSKLNTEHWDYLQDIITRNKHEIYFHFRDICNENDEYSNYIEHVIRGASDLTHLFEFYVKCEQTEDTNATSKGILSDYHYRIHSVVHKNPPVFIKKKNLRNAWKEMWPDGAGPTNISWLNYVISRHALIDQIIQFMNLSDRRRCLLERFFCITKESLT